MRIKILTMEQKNGSESHYSWFVVAFFGFVASKETMAFQRVSRPQNEPLKPNNHPLLSTLFRHAQWRKETSERAAIHGLL